MTIVIGLYEVVDMQRRDFIRVSIGVAGIAATAGSRLALASMQLCRPEDYGAKGDGATDDTLALQKALDSGCGSLYLAANYLVSPQKHPGIPGIIGANSVCLDIKSNIRVYGPGTIILKPGAKGSSGAILANVSAGNIKNCSVEVQIDGNKDSAKGKFSGIVFINGDSCKVTEKTVIKNVSYNGIQFAGSSNNCIAKGSKVSNIGYIGIQAQKPQNIIVSDCVIRKTKDNAIDFESNKGTQNGVIKNNNISDCKAGVFLESGGNCLIADNVISNFKTAGIFLNRINTPADNVKISGNTIKNSASEAKFGGVAINNAIKNVIISGNKITGVKYGIWTNRGISNLTVNENEFSNIGEAILRIARSKNALVRSKISQQIYNGQRVNGKPFTSSPFDNKNNFPERVYQVSITPIKVTGDSHKYNSVDDEYRSASPQPSRARAAVQMKSAASSSRYSEWDTE
ncbi:right-handed parallel beta-helix repeat-containing protein [Serratia ficaria]|uniref:right-handed parallel beta-helix repeat-containing protein n=1 Tax=Serratia ficaria TaxID=61651 RepID=UPI0021BD7B9D|nr:right-handed parallel beta-helix repeat-containing protein [Serratia ficaria]